MFAASTWSLSTSKPIFFDNTAAFSSFFFLVASMCWCCAIYKKTENCWTSKCRKGIRQMSTITVCKILCSGNLHAHTHTGFGKSCFLMKNLKSRYYFEVWFFVTNKIFMDDWNFVAWVGLYLVVLGLVILAYFFLWRISTILLQGFVNFFYHSARVNFVWRTCNWILNQEFQTRSI